jgi:hypothetical protein
MTEAELIREVQDDLSHSCALSYQLNPQEISRIIKRARSWFYDNYKYAVEDRVFVLGNSLFNTTEFRKTRQLRLFDTVVSVYGVHEVNSGSLMGNPDRDFSDSKLLGSELLLSPFTGDNLVYRTAMYSFFDLAKAYLLNTFAFTYNKNTKMLTIQGRDPARTGSPGYGTGDDYTQNGTDIAIRAYIAIPEEDLYDDELFIRYVLAKCKINLSRLLSAFNYNLPGGVTVNTSALKGDGDAELQEVMDMINGENTASYFLQWN